MPKYMITVVEIDDAGDVEELLVVKGPRDVVLNAVPMVGAALGIELAAASTSVTPAEPSAGAAPEAPKSTRTRRTRAQIAADEAAAATAASAQARPGGPVHPADPIPGAAAASADPVPVTMPATELSPGAPPAAPYNPFGG